MARCTRCTSTAPCPCPMRHTVILREFKIIQNYSKRFKENQHLQLNDKIPATIRKVVLIT